LQNPKNDTKDVSNILKQLGFNVELYFDLNFDKMEIAIDIDLPKNYQAKMLQKDCFILLDRGLT
jgi:uncharacterized protein YqgQ